MALTASANGKFTIGDAGDIQQSILFSNSSAVLTEHSSGKAIVAASTAFSIPFGGITSPTALYIRALDDSDDSAVYVDVITSLTTPSIAMRMSEMVMTLSDTPNITALWAVTKSGLTTKVVWSIGG